MPDPNSLYSPTPEAHPRGIMTAEEVWNEIGWPADHPNAESHTPLDAIESTIKRVVRGYEEQAIAQIERSGDMERYSRLSEQVSISLTSSAGVAGTAIGEVPAQYLPYFIGKVVGPSGTPLAAVGDISKVQYTGLPEWQDYRYELAGRDLFVLPESLGGSSITTYLVPQLDAVETALEGAIPEINQQIVQSARQALEARISEARRLEAESLTERPEP